MRILQLNRILVVEIFQQTFNLLFIYMNVCRKIKFFVKKSPLRSIQIVSTFPADFMERLPERSSSRKLLRCLYGLEDEANDCQGWKIFPLFVILPSIWSKRKSMIFNTILYFSHHTTRPFLPGQERSTNKLPWTWQDKLTASLLINVCQLRPGEKVFILSGQSPHHPQPSSHISPAWCLQNVLQILV